jgi:O-antigen/teichoic acid export membrane protein
MPIREPIKQLGKSTAVYGLGNVLNKVAAVLLIPIYTHYLTLSDVGILALLEMVEILMLTIVPLGMNNALWRNLPSKVKSGKRRMIFSAFVGTSVVNFILLGLIGLNYRLPAPFLGLGEDQSYLLLLVLTNVFFTFGFRFLLALLQYEGKAGSYVVFSLCQFVGVLLMTVYLVALRGAELQGVLLAKVVVSAPIFLFASIAIFSKYMSWPSLAEYIRLLRFGLPFVLFALAMPVLTFSDRYFLVSFDVKLSDIGIYYIAYKFGMIINMILVMPLQRGWVPMMYKMGIGEKSRQYLKDILFYYSIVGVSLFMAISFFSEELIGVFAGQDYLVGSSIISLIAFAYLVNGYRQFFMAGTVLTDKTIWLTLSSVVGMAANLVLNYFLIRKFGLLGAAWATLISYTFLSGLVYIISQKFVRLNWGWRRIVNLFFIAGIVIAGVTFLQAEYIDERQLIGLCGIVTFIVFLRITRIIGKREISGVRFLLQKVRLPSIHRNL